MMSRHYSAATAVTAAAALAAALLPAAPSLAQPAGPARQAASTIEWESCEDGEIPVGALSAEGIPTSVMAQCAFINVPRDHAKPQGRQYEFYISRLPATGDGADYLGPLIVSDDTPDTSAVMAAAAALPESVRARYDLIGFDQRGFGLSDPSITCPPTLTQPSPAYEPTSRTRIVGNEKQRLAAAKAYGKSCGRRNDRADLQHLNSAESARDLEVLRKALGAPKLSFATRGFSTYLTQVYATKYPNRVGRMVLGGAENPKQVAYRRHASFPLALDRSLDAFFAWVAGHDFGIGSSGADVRAEFLKFRGELRRNPREVLGAADWTLIFRNFAGFDHVSWPTVAIAWQNLRAGDDALINLLASAIAPDAVFDATVAAQECTDAMFPRSYQRLRSDAFRAAATAPLTGWSELWKNNARCAFWPVRKVQVTIGSTKAPAPLVVAGTAAAIGNPTDASQVVRAFRGARVLKVTDSLDTYADLFQGNDCVDEFVTDYLLTGALPASRATCAALPAPDEAAIEQARQELAAAVLVDQLSPALDSFLDATPELPVMFSRDRRY